MNINNNNRSPDGDYPGIRQPAPTIDAIMSHKRRYPAGQAYIQALAEHISSEADLPRPGPVSCDTCGRSVPSSRVLRLHALSHYTEDCFRCPYCTRTFGRRKSLEEHAKSHEVDSGVSSQLLTPPTSPAIEQRPARRSRTHPMYKFCDKENRRLLSVPSGQPSSVANHPLHADILFARTMVPGNVIGEHQSAGKSRLFPNTKDLLTRLTHEDPNWTSGRGKIKCPPYRQGNPPPLQEIHKTAQDESTGPVCPRSAQEAPLDLSGGTLLHSTISGLRDSELPLRKRKHYLTEEAEDLRPNKKLILLKD